MGKRQILAINGSASRNSSNHAILNHIAALLTPEFDLDIFDDLIELPHFQTERIDNNVPEKIIEFRNKILAADGIIICTPEYVFSIPSGLKNAIEWCVSTTVFSDKPIGLITASASGVKGHDELQLIMRTVQTYFTEETTLLINGVKGKVSKEGKILDKKTEADLNSFVNSFKGLVMHLNTSTVISNESHQ